MSRGSIQNMDADSNHHRGQKNAEKTNLYHKMAPVSSTVLQDDVIADKLKNMDIDNIWRNLGKYGKFQTTQVWFLLLSFIAQAWHDLSILFIGFAPDFLCNKPENVSAIQGSTLFDNASTQYSKCHITTYSVNETKIAESECDYGFNYSIPADGSIVSEWDLVCGRDALSGLTQTIMIFGQGAGSIAAVVADKIGRRPTYIISHGLFFAVVCGTAFVQSYWSFLVLRFFTGALMMVVDFSSWTAIQEVITNEQRPLLAAIASSVWVISTVLMTPLAYFLQDYSWRILQLALTSASVHFLFAIIMMEESLRWLIVSGKTKAAIKLLKKACSVNKVTIEELFAGHDSPGQALVMIGDTNHGLQATPQSLENNKFSSLLSDSKNNAVCIKSDSNGSCCETGDDNFENTDRLLDLLRDKVLLRKSAIVWFAWFVNVLVYYGLYLTSSIMSEDRFLQFLLSSVVDVPAIIVTGFFMQRFGRKFTSIFGHTVSGLALLSSTVLSSFGSIAESHPALITVLVMLGKFGVSVSFGTLYTYTPELFPTSLRNSGIGVASLCGRVAGAIAPYSDNIAKFASWLPGSIFASTSLTLAWLLIFLPETKGRKLPQTIKDMQYLVKDRTIYEKEQSEITFQ